MIWFLVICLSLTQMTFAAKKNPKSFAIPKTLEKNRDPSVVCRQQLELGIVLDSSASIQLPDFNKSINFLQDYLKLFDIGQDSVRVAIIPYARGVISKNAFYLTTYNTKEDVIRAIGRITHTQGDHTDTGEGIKFMRLYQLNIALVRPGVPKVGLVLTDGNSQYKAVTEAEAKAARDSGIHMFAVGVGSGIDDQELLRIAGDKLGVNHVDSFDKLKSIVQRLAVQTCESTKTSKDVNNEDIFPECQKRSLELGIVLDSSASIWVEDFNKSIKFLQTFLQQLVIDKDSVRVAIIPYSYEVHTKNSFNLNTYTTKKDVLNAIGKISHEQGNATYTNKGIKYMRERQLSNAVVRPGVTRIGLVITDGVSHEPNWTATEAKLARDSGIVMFAVGVGTNITNEELFNIAGDHSRVNHVDNFDNLNNIIQSLTKKACSEDFESTTTRSPIKPRPNDQKNPIDIYFVFSPSYLGYEITIWTKELISSIISRDGNKLMKCGFISDQSNPCPTNGGFKLESYSTSKEIAKELNPDTANKLPALIKQLADSGYTVQRGARPNARKVAVLVVEGVKSAELVSNQVKNLLNKGITVFIADPTKSGAKIKGVTTLKGGSEEQATELIQNLLQ
ncbi:collagen alpha-6(VI) chain-like isoform X1 [Biomphalaria glabrata]|uniref:Collagen alpha-6(VI) chain-like isoform X1 n=1 Tax=Biomphalaria glabrata TaxID=6526 RepID=A0A9W2YKC9_BIOGL|nr:collagen alpha-6(VI) chain-like isoform X1 [Biomphalaria glabrata]